MKETKKTFYKNSRLVYMETEDDEVFMLGRCMLKRCKFPTITCAQCMYNI